ncbi:hypothetical protein DITRI_Ditri14bG0042500 [Diplodiscus trichospermus]
MGRYQWRRARDGLSVINQLEMSKLKIDMVDARIASPQLQPPCVAHLAFLMATPRVMEAVYYVAVCSFFE